MKIFLGYETALAYLRKIDFLDPDLITHDKTSGRRPPSAKKIKEALYWLVPQDEQPHLIVPEAKLRQKNQSVKFHVWNPTTHLPCFLKLSDEVLVSTPEALFCQLSSNAEETALMKLAFELCGSYAIDERTAEGFRNRPPLTTTEKLETFARSIGLGERSHALTALKFVRNGSASPMETKLALLLGLPTTKGGYGLGMPEMNGQVAAPPSSSAALSYNSYHCNLYWRKKKVALEYNSSAFHLSEKAATNDSKRLNDLKSIGVTVFTATSRQVFTPKEMDRTVAKIAKAMGKRIRNTCRDSEIRRLELRRKLFSQVPWG